MDLFLLRHGRSVANERGLVTGSRHDALAPEGQEQARQAVALIARHGLAFTFHVVSDWRRAQETAGIFCPEARFAVDARLGETDAGDAAEMPLAAFNRRYPEFWSDFSPQRRYPGGESHQDLYARVADWFEELDRTAPDDASVLAVTHAGPICVLLHCICRTDMRHFPMFLARNASLTHVCRDENKRWRLVSFSVTA